MRRINSLKHRKETWLLTITLKVSMKYWWPHFTRAENKRSHISMFSRPGNIYRCACFIYKSILCLNLFQVGALTNLVFQSRRHREVTWAAQGHAAEKWHNYYIARIWTLWSWSLWYTEKHWVLWEMLGHRYSLNVCCLECQWQLVFSLWWTIATFMKGNKSWMHKPLQREDPGDLET